MKKTYGNEILYIVLNWLKIRFQTSKLKWGEVRLGSTILASFFMAHLIEMLCFTLTGFFFANACMHSVYKSTLFFWYSEPHKDTLRLIYLASFISGVDAELWHFTCTSKSGFAIQLSGISKGHNLYLFVWFLGCQCFCVEHIFYLFFFFWGADVRGLSLAGSVLQHQSIHRRPLWCVLTAVPFFDLVA